MSDFAAKMLVLLLAATVMAGGREAGRHPKELLKLSSRMFDRLVQRPEDAIPDAVLNRTKCIVSVPHADFRADDLIADGVATCRETSDRWGDPKFVSFKENGVRARQGDLLIFLLQDRAVRRLLSGQLDIRTSSHITGPLLRSTPVPSQTELAADSLVYEYAANALSASRTAGVIRLRDEASDRHRARREAPKKVTQQYLSSVTSFFNTIVPTGIVVHHTAIIPGEKQLPRSQAEIDVYHQSRGFEITCFGHIYHVAYHYLILSDGTVQAGRPERCEGAHAEGYNSYLGISVVGDFSSKDNPRGEKGPARPSEQQMASLVELCRRLKDRYRIPLQHIVRHSDISSTRCPGDRFPFGAFLRQVETGASGRAGR